MSITKKLRFEVFKRDGFQCAYCGKSPPAVLLEIDHITPKSKEGKDHINNLLTACFDCNRGKRDIPLDKVPQMLADNLKVLKQKEEQLVEYHKLVRKIERREGRQIAEIETVFQELYPDRSFTESFKRGTVRGFLKALQKDEIIDSMYIAGSKINDDPDRTIRYFCGVCWNKIRGVKNESEE